MPVFTVDQVRQGDLSRTQLLRPELELFRQWFEQEGSVFPEFHFRVLLGPGVHLPPGLPLWVYRCVDEVTALRPDWVCPSSDGWHIFEAKEVSTASLVGQLLMYRVEWERKFPDRKPVHLHAVVRAVRPNHRRTLAQMGVKIHLVPSES